VLMTRAMGRAGYKRLAKNSTYEAFGRGLTFTFFAFTLFWFWGNWERIGRIFTALGMEQWLGVWLAVWLFATIVLASWEWLRAALLSINYSFSDGPLLTSRYARVVWATAFGLVILVMAFVLQQSAPDIVYKTF
jgi:alginate O-acetyltransferase complex protein AlgI